MDEQDQTPITEAIDANLGTADGTEPVIDSNSNDDTVAAPMAATPEPLEPAAPKRRWFGKPLATAALAGVVGLGVGAGAVALAEGFGDDHRHGDRQMGWAHDDRGQQGGWQQDQGQQDRGQQGGWQGQRHQRGQQGQQGQQGGFMRPGNGGQMQGRTGGS